MGHVTGLLKENGKGAGFRTEPFFSSLLVVQLYNEYRD